ncbi:MAG: hypothetical protein ACRECH_16700, partial [Nitrososphaerales archaeon]
LLYYPVGANLITHTLSPLAGLLSFPFQFVNLTFAFNVILLLGFILSCFFGYMLVRHLTQEKYSAFVGGIIFGFSPMHLSQTFIGHLNWTSIEFVPLFVLLFLLMIEKKELKYIFGSAISFLLVLFFGDPEQGIMALIIAFFILLLCCTIQAYSLGNLSQVCLY